jgi:hypothetical protein
MARDKLIEKGVGAHEGFRWRSHEISRIEERSDAVFAALALCSQLPAISTHGGRRGIRGSGSAQSKTGRYSLH